VTLPTLRQTEQFAWIGLFVAFAGFAVHMASYVVLPLLHNQFAPTDFFAQRAFAGFAHRSDAGSIYDAEALNRFQLSLRPDLRQTFSYPYPPSFLLFIGPLGWLGYQSAYAVWTATMFGLYLIVSLQPESRLRDMVFLTLAPVTMIAEVFGQTGFLFAILLLGGLRLLNRYPTAAGVLFGLASFKSQFAVMIPRALFAAAEYRCLLASAATVTLLILTTSLLFGVDLWLPGSQVCWPTPRTLMPPSIRTGSKVSWRTCCCCTPLPLAQIVQAACATVAAILVWRHFPRAGAQQRIAILASATFLAAPYAFLDDIPVLTKAALAMLTFRPRARCQWADQLAAALLLSYPVIVSLTTRFFWLCSVTLILFFVLVVRRTQVR
jgi:alpha-1,2-mannosyltransferase